MKLPILKKEATMNNTAVGYKITEIGIIPEEWEVKELESIIDFKGA